MKDVGRAASAGVWVTLFATPLAIASLGGCSGESGGKAGIALQAESCMTCHNGSQHDDYAGPGLEDPHPFGSAAGMACTTCHGGDPNGEGALASHVPPPPEIGDETNLENDQRAYFNRLTLAGIDKFPDYAVGGTTYTAIDYLQFVNPGDLRVVTQGRGCGQCHANHAEDVAASLLATEAGILSGAMFAIGVENAVPASQGLYEDTAADLGFRAVTDPDWSAATASTGAVGELLEVPVFSRFGDAGPDAIHGNPAYDSADLPAGQNADGSVVTGSPLANLFHEQVAFTCGDCHLGSAGANDRYGDFRSSGCTACHMRKSLSGRSNSGDPNVDPFEPLDPDDIDAPELPHLERHLIKSVARTLPGGELVEGIDDYTCAGCHQGSNRTVMQYWGIRLDQNQDVRFDNQYPANPVSWQSTHGDARLFDPVVGNHTFNGRNGNQYLRFEDYDGDGRDDTPEDVHYEAGMGCIDCHGSYDLHGGDTSAGGAEIASRMEQHVAITCESCHGGIDSHAPTVAGTLWDGSQGQVAVDDAGFPLPHVYRDPNGDTWLRSRLTGDVHYVKQTLDTVVDNGRLHPDTGQPVYSAMASYAMGRADGDPGTGIGPDQAGGVAAGFSHVDSMDCASCHASWTNTCIGCHLGGEYDTGANFSNVTGERIVFEQANADFVYQSPVPFQLGVRPNNRISAIATNTETFFQWEDRNDVQSDVFAFSDRNGAGNNPAQSAFPALSHNAMMPHSIRGKVSASNEGPRYCVACHLTDDALATWGTEYDAFRTAMATNDFASLDFPLLQTHIGLNPGNQIDSPIWVHQVAGLGSGLFLFDEDGCAVNPLDQNDQRVGCEGVAPADSYDPARAHFDLDRIVDGTGASQGSNNHPMLEPGVGPNLRDGSLDPDMAGPLGATIIERLTDPATGIVLDSWFDADGQPQGGASGFLGGP